ncbi:MAG: 2-C-methyl-D-erythritol 2,4-cyclodiphosphate synthase [Planctomycetota bacterium]|nr:2-C-methyl-D-erythritol 2,4-cyclodiphosphate synthase [Planctomycetota bacterium]
MAQVAETSIGFGFDIHRLGDANKPLVVVGMRIPNATSGPIAHSDGDSAIHALIDSILGSIAEGDIGAHFPDSDPKYKNISSVFLLKETLRIFYRRGGHIQHIDMTVILDEPPLVKFRDHFRGYLAALCGLPKERISIKFKHTNGAYAMPVYAAQCAVLVSIMKER